MKTPGQKSPGRNLEVLGLTGDVGVPLLRLGQSRSRTVHTYREANYDARLSHQTSPELCITIAATRSSRCRSCMQAYEARSESRVGFVPLDGLMNGLSLRTMFDSPNHFGKLLR